MIIIAPYDPAWPALFATEAVRIRQALGDLALRIEHVGSTSVPGLAAKPVVDIQVSVSASLLPRTTASPWNLRGATRLPRQSSFARSSRARLQKAKAPAGFWDDALRPRRLLHCCSAVAGRLFRLSPDWILCHGGARVITLFHRDR